MTYRPGLPPVLKGITLSIEDGEKIGVVGRLVISQLTRVFLMLFSRTGAGKSVSLQFHGRSILTIYKVTYHCPLSSSGVVFWLHQVGRVCKAILYYSLKLISLQSRYIKTWITRCTIENVHYSPGASVVPR